MYWYIEALKHYVDFRGVAHRRAFWMFIFVNLVFSVIIAMIETLTNNPGWLDAVYSLLTITPFLALATRRLRDTGLPLWSFLVLLIPMIGVLILIYFLCLPSQPRTLLIDKEGAKV
ncbi:DUF805 domain-containing protein [Marinomonas fungiae]|uniref:DUF805 domain-containing protein n=1 Tax=Marinomonas fungiae TaxID=1137284 RepID=UPI003A94E60F